MSSSAHNSIKIVSLYVNQRLTINVTLTIVLYASGCCVTVYTYVN